MDVSPDGKWIIGSGKLQGVTTAFNFEKIQTAIRNKDFTGNEDGIPVLKYESIKDAEVAVGLDKYATDYKGIIAGVKIDPTSGEMSLAWQLLMPPFDFDLGDAGKLASDG